MPPLATPPRDCPCTSGLRYDACCGPYHRLVREAPDAAALMRSRYAAFAVKDGEYLWRTLHPDHDDRALAKPSVVLAIREACEKNRYMGLVILDHAPAPVRSGVAHVLFWAKVFTRGRDVSFIECSDFLHDGEGWRYLAGTLVPLPSVVGDPASLTIATLSERTRSS